VISPTSESRVTWHGLVWLVINNNLGIHYLPVITNLLEVYEEDGIGFLYVSVALGKAPKIIGEGSDPHWFRFLVLHEMPALIGDTCGGVDDCIHLPLFDWCDVVRDGLIDKFVFLCKCR
jgi:hypothetical protein